MCAGSSQRSATPARVAHKQVASFVFEIAELFRTRIIFTAGSTRFGSVLIYSIARSPPRSAIALQFLLKQLKSFRACSTRTCGRNYDFLGLYTFKNTFASNKS